MGQLLKQLARDHDVERGDRVRIMSLGTDAATLAGGSPAAVPALIVQHGRRGQRGKNGSAQPSGTHTQRCTEWRDGEIRANFGLHSGLSITKGCGRVGHRRVALSHVSCTPSSNWTCGFPASSSPTSFFRRRAPQTRQMAHATHHVVQPTAFVQELIVPALPGRPPTALMFTSEP